MRCLLFILSLSLSLSSLSPPPPSLSGAQSLADLSAPSRQLSFRTVSCMKLVLRIGLEEGNNLEDNWLEACFLSFSSPLPSS